MQKNLEGFNRKIYLIKNILKKIILQITPQKTYVEKFGEVKQKNKSGKKFLREKFIKKIMLLNKNDNSRRNMANG